MLERGSEEERREGAALLEQLRELQSWSRDTAGQLAGLRQAAQQLSAGAGAMEAVAEERARAAEAAHQALLLQESLRAQLSEAHSELAAAQLRAASAMREAAQSAETAAEARRAETEQREAAQRSGAVAAAALQALQALKNALFRDDGSLEALRAELEKVDLREDEEQVRSPARLLEAALEAAAE